MVYRIKHSRHCYGNTIQSLSQTKPGCENNNMRKRINSEANTFRTKLQRKLEENLSDVTRRSMFGYECYSVKGNFFAGFSKKDKDKLIIRLSKDIQKKALSTRNLKIIPFSHGAKMGWIELNCNNINKTEGIFSWIRQGYNYALTL